MADIPAEEWTKEIEDAARGRCAGVFRTFIAFGAATENFRFRLWPDEFLVPGLASESDNRVVELICRKLRVSGEARGPSACRRLGLTRDGRAAYLPSGAVRETGRRQVRRGRRLNSEFARLQQILERLEPKITEILLTGPKQADVQKIQVE